MKKLNLMALCLIATSSIHAYDFEKDGFYFNITSIANLTAQLTCSGPDGEYDEYNNNIATYSGDITVPSNVEYAGKTFAVTSINNLAFINCNIGTLTIPTSVLNIGTEHSHGLGLCGIFRKLVIEDSETPIRCFRALIAGDVTESVYLGRQIEGEQMGKVVYNSSSYKEITFGNNVTRLDCTCEGNTGLVSVVLPESIRYLEDAFLGCTALKSFEGPGVEEIIRAFYGCCSIENVYLPNLRFMRSEAFGSCTSIKSFSFLPGLIGLGKSSYEYDVFSGCTNLESIIIPSTVMEMGVETNYDNPENFADCSNLKTITMCNPTPIKLAESNFASLTYITATLKVPVGAAEAYRKADVWKNFFNIEEDSSISDDIFTLEVPRWDEDRIEMSVNEALPAYDNYLFVKKGEKVEIKVKPDEGYKLLHLLINEVDVTEDVVDNIYQTTMSGGMSISVDFIKDEAQKQPFLTIQQADNGAISTQVQKGSKYTFFVTPSQGWKIHSVTFNDEDITNQLDDNGKIITPSIIENSTLFVVYELDDIDEVRAINESEVAIQGTSNGARVTGANKGEMISIYTTDGCLLHSLKVEKQVVDIPLHKENIYIIKVGTKTMKLSR